jgi:hypothetical protein
MNRHDRRRLDTIHQKFLAQLPRSDEPPHVKEVKQRFFAWLEDLRKDGKLVPQAFGVYGEWQGNSGFIEDIIRPETGGVFIKLWGCSYLFKGLHDARVVHGMELAKFLVSEFPRNFIGKSKLLLIAFGLMFLFRRKAFLMKIDHLLDAILAKSVRWLNLPDSEYNAEVLEIRRAGQIAIEKVFSIPQSEQYDYFHMPWKIVEFEASQYRYHTHPKVQENQLGYICLRFLVFLVLFLQNDTAYMFRIQDAIGAAQPLTLFGIFEVLMTREVGEGVLPKWKFIKKGMEFGFWFMPQLKQLAEVFCAELNVDKVKMDDSDWYFCLHYVSYNFGGKSKEERFAERKKIDEEKQHVLLFS